MVGSQDNHHSVTQTGVSPIDAVLHDQQRPIQGCFKRHELVSADVNVVEITLCTLKIVSCCSFHGGAKEGDTVGVHTNIEERPVIQRSQQVACSFQLTAKAQVVIHVAVGAGDIDHDHHIQGARDGTQIPSTPARIIGTGTFASVRPIRQRKVRVGAFLAEAEVLPSQGAELIISQLLFPIILQVVRKTDLVDLISDVGTIHELVSNDRRVELKGGEDIGVISPHNLGQI
mmetsp:Transcript_20312/g.34244  ORF Transcript_20312/g.34244 Transcript_20312/m.34244 type:complete len:230 (+) Transcript_20312:3127-3816(+)